MTFRNGALLYGSAQDGGAVALTSGTSLTLHGPVEVRGNTAERDGGAIYAFDASIFSSGDVVFGGFFVSDQNSAGDDGGAIYMEGGELDAADVSFPENHAAGCGGAVAVAGATTSITDGEFGWSGSTHNSAGERGGAIAVWSGELELTGGSFLNNDATETGGAIDLQAVTSESQTVLRAHGVTFEQNDAAVGGAITGIGGTHHLLIEIEDSFLDSNGSDTVGGAIWLQGGTSGGMFVANSTFVGNDATLSGGAIAVQALHTETLVTLLDSTFDDNHAGGDGGALFLFGFDAEPVFARLDDVDFTGNHAGGVGGAIFVDNSVLKVAEGGLDAHCLLECAIFAENTADDGAAVHVRRGGSAAIHRSKFVGNESSTSSAASAIRVTGAGSTVLVANSLLHGQTRTATPSGALVADAGARLDILNATVANNQGWGIVLDSATATLDKSIVWGNTSGGGYAKGTYTFTATCNDAQSPLGGSNISVDPGFVDAAAGDFETTNSATWNRCSGYVGFSLDGISRDRALIDMGAFEH